MARRVLDGVWLDRDLPLTGVSWTSTLNGPGTMNFGVPRELNRVPFSDGLRLFDDWATLVYVVDESQQIVNHGISMPPLTPEVGASKVTCCTVSGYVHGYLFDQNRLWGPDVGNGSPTNPQVPRPDPLAIAHDLWDYVQDQRDSDLGVMMLGDDTTRGAVKIGNFEEPYRLRFTDQPDVGQEIDNLAESTPFDYVDGTQWSGDPDDPNSVPVHTVTWGYPRLGSRREDLRFVLGENIAVIPEVSTLDGFANDVLGVGKGNGAKMARGRATVSDGRLRRTRIITDKTADNSRIQTLSQQFLNRLGGRNRLNISQVAIVNHRNADLATIVVGDEVFVQFFHPEWGDVAQWVRVTGITRADDPDKAVLTTANAETFWYSGTVGVSS